MTSLKSWKSATFEVTCTNLRYSRYEGSSEGGCADMTDTCAMSQESAVAVIVSGIRAASDENHPGLMRESMNRGGAMNACDRESMRDINNL